MAAPCLSQIALKYGLHQCTLPVQILPQSDSPLLIWALENGKPLENHHHWPPTTSFPLKWTSQMCPFDQLRDVCCHLANMIEDTYKAAVCYAGCHYELSGVAFCQITLALVCCTSEWMHQMLVTWQFLASPTSRLSVCLNRIHSQVTLSVTVPSTNLATLTSKTIHPASRHHAFSCGGWHFVLYQMSCAVICALHCVADVLSYQQRCNYFVSWLENKHGLAYVSLLYHMLHCSWVVCVVMCSSVVYTCTHLLTFKNAACARRVNVNVKCKFI